MIILSPGKKAFPFYIFVAWFSLFAGTLCAQQNFNILHFTNDNFLPQNSVSHVAFDKYGYTWISTQYGLVRYDGAHFRTYNTVNTPALKNNRFMYVANDRKGNIYALDGRHSVIQASDTGFIDRPDLLFRENCFFPAQFVNFKGLEKEHNRLFKDLDPFKKGDLLQTVFYIDSVRFYFTSPTSAGYFDGKKVYIHRLTGVINGFKCRGLLFASLADGTFNVYKDDRQVATALKMEGNILANAAFKKWGIASTVFTSDPDSNAYIFCNRALYLVTGSESHITAQLLADSLEAKECYYIGHNAVTGVYYLCSQVDGIYILAPVADPNFFASLVIPSLQGDPNLNVHYAIVQAGKNKILSTNNYLFDNNTAHPFLYNFFSRFSLYRDNNYHLFFQNWSDYALYETDTLFHVLAKYPLDGSALLKCTAKDSKGLLWAAVDNKLGVLQNGAFHFYPGKSPFKEIESFIIQHDSLIWLATTGGLFLFHTNDHRLDSIKELSGINVRTLKTANDGSLWIGTYGQGFYRYKNKRLVKFPADKNGYLSIAHCFMEDRNGFFWITTNHGLFQVKKSDLDNYADGKSEAVYYHYYDKTSGFSTNEFNGGCDPCGIRIDSFFILPSINGLVKFNPESIQPLLPSGAIFIDKISADTISYSPVSSFSLGPKFHQLAFEVSSAYYGNINNNNIEYHIQGLDENWYPLNDDGKITITTLPHDNYTLQLRRLSGFGLNNYIYKNISFKVAPNFYETIWFRILVLLFMAVLVWLGFRIRYNLLQKQKKFLQKQVAERTAALEQSVEELHQSENALYSNIQQKEKIASILLHDLKSPLRFLTLVSNHIHNQIDHGNRDDLKKLTQDIMNSSQRISMVTDEFLAWLLSDNNDYTLNNESVFLKPLAEEINDFFAEMVESNHNVFNVDVREDLKVIADERVMRAILRNLVDNANKHTYEGIISLKAFSRNGITEIKVSDTGQGMMEEQLQSFSRGESNTPGFSRHIGNHLGSRIIRDFVHKLGGSLTVTSEAGKGTTITLFFKN